MKKQSADLSPPTMLRLSEIERLIRRDRIIVPTPSRRTLIRMCDEGVFTTASRRKTRDPYLVSERSFLDWVASLCGDAQKTPG